MKYFFSLFICLISLNIKAQDNQCNLPPSTFSESIQTIDLDKLKCLAKQSTEKTLIYTFAIWCPPCRIHFNEVKNFAKEHNLNFYVLLVDKDKKESKDIFYAEKFLKNKDENTKILLLDNKYGKRARQKNRNFVTEISTPNFENIADFSKIIIINTKGEVELVTTYKDSYKEKDFSNLFEKKVKPLILKK